MRAGTLHKLVTGLGFERCILAGGSGGARDSMLTTMLYPEMVTKLVVWNLVGGIYGPFVLGSFYIVPSILAVRGTGMDGVVKVQEWRERIEENPANKQRFLDFDKDEFLKLMLRWLNAFVSKPGQTIPGVEDEMFDRIKVPTLIIRGGENDMDHPKRTSLQATALARGRLGTRLRRPRGGPGAALQHVRHLGAGRTRDPQIPGLVVVLNGANVNLAVERCLEGGVDPAFRNAIQVGFAQGHVDDVEAVIAGRPDNLAGEP